MSNSPGLYGGRFVPINSISENQSSPAVNAPQVAKPSFDGASGDGYRRNNAGLGDLFKNAINSSRAGRVFL